MIRVRKLSDQVYQHLFRLILSGELAPGSSLQEVELADRLGVSRTPIREALVRLAENGFVKARPNRSMVVRQLGREDLVHFHQVREALEGLAAELACGRLTEEDFDQLDALARAAREEKAPSYFAAPKAREFDIGLHSMVAKRSGNPVLESEILRLHEITRLIMEQVEAVLSDRGRISPDDQEELLRIELRQHTEIVAALRSGDPTASREAMVRHLRSIGELRAARMPTRAEMTEPREAAAGALFHEPADGPAV